MIRIQNEDPFYSNMERAGGSQISMLTCWMEECQSTDKCRFYKLRAIIIDMKRRRANHATRSQKV